MADPADAADGPDAGQPADAGEDAPGQDTPDEAEPGETAEGAPPAPPAPPAEPPGRYRPPNEEAVADAVGDAVNRCILAAVSDEARPVKEVAEACDLALATAYRHVNDLAEKGLLFLERSAISAEGKRVDLYRAAVRRVELTFRPDGAEVRYELVEDAADRLRRVWMDIKEHREARGTRGRGRGGDRARPDASEGDEP